MDHLLRVHKFKETGDLNYIYKNESDKDFFDHDAAYIISKDLAKRTISEKILKDRAYKIAINPKYDGYKKGLGSMVNKCFDKKTGSGVNVNEMLAQELKKPVIKTLRKEKCI